MRYIREQSLSMTSIRVEEICEKQKIISCSPLKNSKYFMPHKGPVKLIKQVKIAHSFLQSVSNQFHVIILSLPM